MTRHNAWGGTLGCFAAVLAVASVIALAPEAGAQIGAPGQAIEARGGAYTLVQQRPGLRQRGLRRNRPISERRRLRRPPDAFRGLMTPGFGARGDCLRPRQIRRRLKRQGWWDFHGLRPAGDDFVVRARRPNGAVYQLTIEGCRGRVVEARPLNGDGGQRLWAR